MATAVFVEQRVIEQDAGIVYGRIVRNKRALAEHRRAFVHRNKFIEQFGVLFRTRFHNLAVFKAYPEIIDEFALIRERFCSVNDTVGKTCDRRSKYLFRGNVGVVINSAERVFAAAHKYAV